MPGYDLVLSESAAMKFATTSRVEQRRLAGVLERLKAEPSRIGDLRELDAYGRVNEIAVI